MNKNWVTRARPARLERRFEFAGYEETREFLDRASELAKNIGNYPDMSFSRTHVSVTLYPGNGAEQVGEDLQRFASQLDDLIGAPIVSH